ncbi:MAG: hypothetical protein AB7H43_14500 [Acidimicrobiia bacterium]
MADLVLRTPEGMTLAGINDYMGEVELLIADLDTLPALQEVGLRLEMFRTYVEGHSREGVARIEAARRRLELRIGQIADPPAPGSRTDLEEDEPNLAGAPARLSRPDLTDRRALAEHPDVVEDVIAGSTDESPPSRRKTMDAIRRRKEKPPTEPASPDPDVALIQRRRVITEQLVRLDRQWDKVAAHPAADFDKHHAAVLQTLGRAVLKLYAEIDQRPRAATTPPARPPAEPIDVPSREAEPADPKPDPIAETRAALDALGSAAEVPDEIVEEEAMLGSGSPSSTSSEEGGTEVPAEPVDPPDVVPEAASADAPPSSSVEPAGAPEVPTGDPDPIAGFASAVEAAVEAPGEPGSPFVVFLDARQTLIRGPRSDVLVDAFEDAKAVLVDWLAGFVADKAPRLDELVEEHWDAVDDDARERAVGAMRGILRAGAALAHRSLPGGLDHYLKLDPRPATTHRGSVLDVHVNEITALLRQRAAAA